MSVSRGKFLKSLGRALPGMALGTGIAAAAQALLGKIAPVLGEEPAPVALETEVPFIYRGPGEGNRIALTFDDGPTPGVTDLILDELKQRKILATFFMIGERIVAAPDLARRVLAEGHEIGNHTFTHPKLTTLSNHQVELEIRKTEEIVSEILGYRVKWFRPPYGALRRNQVPNREGMGIVFWSVDSRDWSQPGEAKIMETILAETKPGSIILCHDLHSQTAQAVGPILEGLLERSFEFMTISELLSQPFNSIYFA